MGYKLKARVKTRNVSANKNAVSMGVSIPFDAEDGVWDCCHGFLRAAPVFVSLRKVLTPEEEGGESEVITLSKLPARTGRLSVGDSDVSLRLSFDNGAVDFEALSGMRFSEVDCVLAPRPDGGRDE